MNVTLLNLFYLPDISPTAQLAASLAEHLALRGDNVTVVCGRGRYTPSSENLNLAPTTHKSGPRVLRLWTPNLGRRSLAARAGDYLSFYAQAAVQMLFLPRQDVIVAMTTPPFIALAACLHKFVHPRSKLVLWNMDSYPEVAEMTGHLRRGSAPSLILRAANRFLFRRLDQIVALDTVMAQALMRAYAPLHGGLKVAVIPNWEPAAVFAAVPEPWRGDPLQSLRERFVILYLGNAGNAHDFRAVIAAADRVRNDPISFLFVGGGAKWSELERARVGHGLSNIVLHGYVPKEATGSLMSSCHAALITLRDEAVGLVSPSKLHAYLAIGLPVIYVGPMGSNVDEAIRNHDIGFSLRTDDSTGLVEALLRLQSEPELVVKLRKNARAAFNAFYSDSQALPKFVQIFLRLIRPNSGL